MKPKIILQGENFRIVKTSSSTYHMESVAYDVLQNLYWKNDAVVKTDFYSDWHERLLGRVCKTLDKQTEETK